MKTGHVMPDEAEWDAMWSMVARTYGDASCLCETSGEQWQYMGSVYGDHKVGFYKTINGWRHEFRHRNLPETGKRTYFHVGASAGWTPQKEFNHASEAIPF